MPQHSGMEQTAGSAVYPWDAKPSPGVPTP
jgi:hypothetical protein